MTVETVAVMFRKGDQVWIQCGPGVPNRRTRYGIVTGYVRSDGLIEVEEPPNWTTRNTMEPYRAFWLAEELSKRAWWEDGC